jgi:hypothetical protein
MGFTAMGLEGSNNASSESTGAIVVSAAVASVAGIDSSEATGPVLSQRLPVSFLPPSWSKLLQAEPLQQQEELP